MFVSGVDEEKRRALTLQGVPEHCCQSALWDRNVRDNATDNKITEKVVFLSEASLKKCSFTMNSIKLKVFRL